MADLKKSAHGGNAKPVKPKPAPDPAPAKGTPERAAWEQRRLADRRRRFVDYAEKRLSGAMKALDRVIACSNKASYDYSPAEAGAITGAIEKKAEELALAFAPSEGGKTIVSILDPSWRK